MCVCVCVCVCFAHVLKSYTATINIYSLTGKGQLDIIKWAKCPCPGPQICDLFLDLRQTVSGEMST